MKNSVKATIFILTILVYSNFMVDKYPSLVYDAPLGLPMHAQIIKALYAEDGFRGIVNHYACEENKNYLHKLPWFLSDWCIDRNSEARFNSEPLNSGKLRIQA